MRIAISCHPTHGGSGVVATELAMGLAQRGHEVHVVSHERPFRLTEGPNLTFHTVPVTDYPLFRYPPHGLSLANVLAELAVDRNLDIIHAHYAVPHAISAMLARDMLCLCERKVKVVTTVHGTDITLVGSHKDFYRVCRYAMAMADGTTAVSHWLAQRTNEVFNLADAPVVIPNFVDCDRFKPDGRVGPAEDGAYRIMHASNFRPVKRVFDIIRVFALMRQRLANARMVMVGDGPERGSAAELAAELGVAEAVDFVGTQVDIQECYRRSHLFMLLSQYESFGVSALEAMACGTPVIASRAGGLVEVVEDGVTGRLCAVGHVDQIAETACEILADADRWRTMSLAARMRAHRQFCKDLVVPEYEEYYQNIIEADAAPAASGR